MLKPVRRPVEVHAPYRQTPIEDLFAFHNWGEPHRTYPRAELLVGMCMDHRKRLRIPENFAYVMRSAGANFRGLEFQISFAVAVGGVRAIALIGHNQCGMVDLGARRSEFIHGLIDRAGWSRSRAERHFDGLMPQFEIGDAAELVHSQARDLQQQYPPLVVAPLMYDVEDGMLYQLDEPAEGNR